MLGKIQLVNYFHSLLLGSTPSPSLAACGSLWPGVARNTGAVIWTAGRSISQGPRRCEIWDTFHSTLPSFWQKKRDSTKPGEQKGGGYLYWSEISYFFKGPWLMDLVIDSPSLTSFLNWLRERRANICHFDISIMAVEPCPLELQMYQ